MAPPDDVENSSTGQELLENLIKEGLTPSGHDNEPSRYRRLVQVLFQNCILKPIERNLPPNIQQCEYTITILKRQTAIHPNLLLDQIDGDIHIPFFQWLLPRLVYAALRLEDENLVDELISSAVNVIYALGKDMSDDDSTWAKGPKRVTVTLGYLNTFCQDILDSRNTKMYGFEDLPNEPNTLLITLSIILSVRLPFTDTMTADACAKLSQASRLMRTTSLQARYTLYAASACSVTRPHELTKACLFVANLSIVEDANLQKAIIIFYDRLAQSDEVLRCEVWWSLYRRIDTLRMSNEVDFSCALFLLAPIPPRLSSGTIRHLIHSEILVRWKDELAHNPSRLDRLEDLIGGIRIENPRKRKRSEEEAEALAIITEVIPDFAMEGDVVESLRNSRDLSALAGVMPRFVCTFAGCQKHGQSPLRSLSESFLDVWIQIGQADLAALQSLARILDHTPLRTIAVGTQLSSRQGIIKLVFQGLKASERSVRVAAGRILSLLFAAQSEHPDQRVASRNRRAYLEKVAGLFNSPLVIKETAILVTGDIGRQANPDALSVVLQMLIRQLGSSSAPLRSLAYTELLGLTRHHNKTPYTLISPFLEDISVLLAENLARSPDMIAETMQFIGFTRQNFLSTTLQYTLPALVLTRNREALQHVASIVKERLGVLLMDNIANILARVFLHPQQTDNSLKFLVTLIQNMTSGNPKAQPVISAASLMTACIVDFVVMLVVELGDEERSVRESAKTALEKAQAQQDGRNSDLGAFLKPLMLGVISQLNDMLHDVLGKKTVEFKRKIIRSLGALIRFVGDSMASFSPQIMASLQSTLGISELRQETLRTWSLFISTLRYADVGPFVGRTTGALVANWPTFDAVERTIAIQIIDEIAGNVKHLSQFVEEVVGMDNIPELRSAAARLTAHRKNWPLRLHISKVLDRVNSKNIAIATASLNELKLLIAKNEEELHMLVRGDTFDSIAARVMSSLLSTATRDGDCQELRDLSYECMGMLGALDPDRLGLRAESGTITLTSNFTDQEESFDFALHLVRDLLVDAFRATNDTKHQTHLAYAIQELLKFCGFTPKILHPGNKVHAGTLTRWQSLPKDQLETLTPLLESRFSISDATVKSFPHPIYSNSPTYREWLQRWATDLVGKVMSMPGHDRPVRDSKMIFGVFRGILRNQDVTVAHHILPHLVLSVLLSGDASYRDEICLEINAVLQDQVNPTGSADKRNLSAQVIFDLMDHLSKWLRLNRVAKSDRTDITRIVEGVLSSIETELMANAALQSRAYARSLRSFEQRIVQLRREKRENTELQTYFERLHQIYSELDEPDGMEGVSAFVISPSLEHQIREHESTGRWTSAQSCWEVRLQQSPDDVSLHVGLLKCLRNLGHYDTLRTHIRGVLSRYPTWASELAPFAAEAAWIIGDWDTVKQIGSEGPPVGHALLALHENQDLAPVLTQVRRDLGVGITGKQYGHAYEPLLQLHLVHEIAMIHKAKQSIEITPKSNNRNVIIQQHVRSLTKSFKSRFLSTSPAFRVREAILSIRRTAYSVVNTPLLNPEIGDAWILSSKIARKSGYEQTAYSATLQAKEAEAPFAFVQQAKLLRVHGSVFKALTDLQNTLIPLLGADPARKDGSVIDLTRDDDFARDRNLAKAVLLVARWANETDRFEPNAIINRYQQAILLYENLESPYYHLGHYYDSMTGSPEQMATFHYYTCFNYVLALQHGVKYIYQTMPRMLTIWLDLGESKELKKHDAMGAQLTKITNLVDRSRKTLPPYQFLTAFPQIISRILHPHGEVGIVLKKIVAGVIRTYPQQALWPTVGVMQSKRADRKKACLSVLSRAQANDNGVAMMVKDANVLSSALLKFTDDQVEDKRKEFSLKDRFPYLSPSELKRTRMILPLQDALTCSLPTTSETIKSHNPFPTAPVEIAGFDDRVEVMQSLQKPKKLVFIGTDGKNYPFLCKPHDDLRKDARLMDLNSMINKLLKSASESRRRQLYIRTYAVMPLNEECGLLEWVTNTYALKSILEKGYARYGKKIYTNDIHTTTENARKQNSEVLTNVFTSTILPRYTPTVFHEWFLTTWPEPSAWLASRLAYGRTLAVMSMIGYVLGLGDRHGENILFDGLSGDTVHVDLNCLFDKGKTFDIPERVPFRLTHNMVDALGVTGVEGVFRKAAEITMSILRSNSDSLMSVLEAFVHDPLVEWTKPGRSKSERDIRSSADRNLRPIKAKLRGIMEEGTIVSVPSQVEALIKQATSPSFLAAMYVGWAPWL
nr:uncharacterized protein CI109_004533 [Kwoniella shandongensis]KAA5526998.1 hypothetical protein CI109_004533 [Kwoniella shandongensis]